MKIKPDVEEKILLLSKKYPRLASTIRLMWYDDTEAEQYFMELLHYKADYDRKGFDPDDLLLVEYIQKAYKQDLDAFRLRNMSEEQRKTYLSQDVWSAAYDGSSKRKSRNPYSKD